MTIWKFDLVLTDNQSISMPKGAQILSVQWQNGIRIWAMCDDSAELIERHFVIRGTGHVIPERLFRTLTHLASVQVDIFVWHVFEDVKG